MCARRLIGYELSTATTYPIIHHSYYTTIKIDKQGNHFHWRAGGSLAMHSFPGRLPHFWPFKQLFQGSSATLNRLYLQGLSADIQLSKRFWPLAQEGLLLAGLAGRRFEFWVQQAVGGWQGASQLGRVELTQTWFVVGCGGCWFGGTMGSQTLSICDSPNLLSGGGGAYVDPLMLVGELKTMGGLLKEMRWSMEVAGLPGWLYWQTSGPWERLLI